MDVASGRRDTLDRPGLTDRILYVDPFCFPHALYNHNGGIKRTYRAKMSSHSPAMLNGRWTGSQSRLMVRRCSDC